MGKTSQDKQTGLLSKSFNTWRSGPWVWLFLSLASLPLIFLRMAVLGESAGSHVYILLWILGELIIFCIVFLMWCLAALFYYFGGRTSTQEINRLWYKAVSRDKEYFIRLSLRFWVFQMIYIAIAGIPFVIILIVVAVVKRAETISNIVNEPWFFFAMVATYILSGFLVVRICLSPQIAMLVGQMDRVKAKATMKESILMVKKDYRRVLFMFLPPWTLGYILYYFLGQLIRGYASTYLSLLLLLVMACVEGGRISFIAAGFSEYFKEVYR
jgi:hypothetical protein